MEDDPYLPLHRACSAGNARQLGRYLQAGANINQRDTHGCTPLIIAIKHGFATNAFQLFDYNPDLNVQDTLGKTALLYAVENDNDCMVLHLLARNADPNRQDVLGDTPLIVAMKRGFINVATRIVNAADVDVNLPDYNGLTALNIAAEQGQMQMVHALIRRRASVHLATCRKRTPLIAAATNGHVHVVECLIDHAASIDVVDVHGFCAIQYACQNGHADVVRLLVKEGARVYVRDPTDRSTLLITAITKGHEDIADFLVTVVKLDVNAADCAGRTALYYACKCTTDTFKLLLDHHASPHVMDRSEKTVLMRAGQVGNVDACRQLLERQVNVNCIDADGNTALMYACLYGKSEVAALLLDHGASATIADEDHQTPLMQACFLGHEAVVDVLLGRRETVDIGIDFRDSLGSTALHRACIRNRRPIVNKLLGAGASPFIADQEGVTPLMLACSFGNDDMMHSMLILRADHVDAEDNNQQTALFYACKLEHDACLDVLLDYNVNVNKADSRGVTPLILASVYGNLSIVTKLVNRGASLDAQDSGSRTALYYACDSGNSHVAVFLLQRGANPVLACSNLTTPLMLGCIEGDKTIVSALLATNVDPMYVNLVDDHSMSALFHAASEGHGHIVGLLLGKNADVRVTSDTGATPLVAAAGLGDVGIIKSILATLTPPSVRAAYINATDDEHRTALHVAANIGSCAVIKCLVENGASLDSVDDLGNTPLHLASLGKHVHAVKLLVDYSHNTINHRNRNNKTVLYYALRSRSHDMIKHVMQHGADLRYLFESRLIWTSGYPSDLSVTSLRLLLDHVDNDLIDAQNAQGKTALFLLAFSFGNKYESMQLCLEKGANPWIPSNGGSLPIHGARTLSIRHLLKDAMYEPDRFYMLQKARAIADAQHQVEQAVSSASSSNAVVVKTRAQKRQKCIASTPALFKTRLSTTQAPLPSVKLADTTTPAQETLVGVMKHVYEGRLTEDLFVELHAMMKTPWEG
jgi:ankyrin repeat protein